MGGRIVLLVTSPRVPAGLLTAQAWDLLRGSRVLAATADGAQAAAMRAAGVTVTVVEPVAAALLAELAGHPTVVWLAGPAGDQDLARGLGLRLAREPGLAELELMVGSWDPPGARLLDAVAVVDQLIAPGGDPWLASHAGRGPAGAHASLAGYLVEEAYEAVDAMRAGGTDEIREELGDVLFQVVLHAAVAAMAGADGFNIDDVAGDLVAKLIRRNPHVFDGVAVADLDEITHNWERIKRAEKARGSAMDGITLSQPALSLAAQVLTRAERAGLPVPRPAAGAEPADGLARRLFDLVAQAHAAGVDAEAALRTATLDRIAAIREIEATPGANDSRPQ